MTIEQLTNAERQEIIDKYYQYNDDRPLTKEILEELGFKRKIDYLEYETKTPLRLFYYGDGVVSTGGMVLFKKLGSVRMLIEALKGDD